MIAEIKGLTIQIDREDIKLVMKYSWSVDRAGFFKRVAKVDGVSVCHLLHREIMGNPDGMRVIFKNEDKLDLRRENLQTVFPFEIPHTSGDPAKCNKSNKSGLKGVYYDTAKRLKLRWRAQIRVNSKKIPLGRFATPEEAHAAYVDAVKKYYPQ